MSTRERLPGVARAVARRARPYWPFLAVSFALAAAAIGAIVRSAGHAAVPLDDAFIHFQYAKRLAEGALFRYAKDQGYTTGATSLLWPLALAPLYGIGFRDLRVVHAAWALGTLAHAALALETSRVARRLVGPATGIVAGAMCLAFGAFAWFAWSGMETVALAWIITRAVRLASEVVEPEPLRGRPTAQDLAASIARTDLAARSLLVTGLLAPLVRPEGAIASLIAAVALGLATRKAPPRKRLRALVPLAGVLITPALHLALAGHATSSTAIVKWLPLSPYVDAALFFATFGRNVRLLVFDLIDGGEWTNLFVPEGATTLFLLGVPALAAAAFRRRAPFTAACVMTFALGMLIPCTYSTLLWNRVRYIWPFFPALFVMVACVCEEAGQLARRARPGLVFLGPAFAGAFAGALATHLPWTIRDLAQSAAAVDQQQVKLGRWARENLPEDARIGVNDTGAIAYFSERETFDVVGLTTEGEARYWVAGAGSRFEHYEKLARERLPTHFIVYPNWMACPVVLGAELTRATVTEQSILGGATMTAYEARWDALGTGALPRLPQSGRLLDELDVADLESERAHHYKLGDTNELDNQVATDWDVWSAKPTPVTDGGRFHRERDVFRVEFGEGRKGRLVARLGGEEPVDVAVTVNGAAQGTLHVPASVFDEVALDVEGPEGEAEVTLEAPEGFEFASFHYWLFDR